MLSAETAAGLFPVEAIQAMDRVCFEAEKEAEPKFSGERMMKSFLRADEAIAMSAVFTSVHLNIKGYCSAHRKAQHLLVDDRLDPCADLRLDTPG